jgi:hypothetical protein
MYISIAAIGHGMEDIATDGPVGQLTQPSLDEVQPGPVGRGEVLVEPGMLDEPGQRVRVHVSGVFDQNHMNR